MVLSNGTGAAAPLRVQAPAGWSVDQMFLTDPSGTAGVTIAIQASRPGQDAAALAASENETLDSLPGYQEQEIAELAPGGRTVVVRRFSIAADGGDRSEHLRAYRTEGPYAILGTRTVLPGADPAIATVAGLVAGLELVQSGGERSFDYSLDELAVMAELIGDRAFPGTGDHAPSNEARRTARLALSARGTVARGRDGRLAVEPAQRTLLAAVLGADVVLSAERQSPAGSESRLYHVTHQLTVAQSAVAPGMHRLTGFPTRQLQGRLASFLELREGEAPAGEAFAMPASEFERLRGMAGTEELEAAASNGLSAGGKRLAATLAAPVSTARVRMLRRRKDRLTGGEVAWLDTGEGGVWLLSQHGGDIRLAPESGTGIMGRIKDA